MYWYHWGGFVAILCIRLQTVFKDNPVENTKYHGFNRITCAVIFIVVVGYTIIGNLCLIAKLSFKNFAVIVTLLILLVLIYSIILVVVFVRRVESVLSLVIIHHHKWTMYILSVIPIEWCR